MHALSARARKRDVVVAKDVVDELVHRGLLKLAAFTRSRAELGRSSDLLGKEVRNVCSRLVS